MQATYVYDAPGRRIEKDVTQGGVTTTTRFAYDGSEIWADLSSSNALVTRYLRGKRVLELLARIASGGAAAWVLADRMGSVRVVVDNTGAVLDVIVYDGYGNVTSESAPTNGGAYRYAGYRYDSETGLYRPDPSTGRYYGPAVGTWYGRNPWGFGAGDVNLYRYVRNSPTNATDPNGMITATKLSQTNLGLGGFQVKFRFELSKPAPADGYIVQNVIYNKDIDGQQPIHKVFWEAWFVKSGQTKETGDAEYGYTDAAEEPRHPRTTGTVSVTGQIKFFLKTVTGDLGDPAATPIVLANMATGWENNNDETFAGVLPSTVTRPQWWNNVPDNNEPVGARSVTANWSDPPPPPPPPSFWENLNKHYHYCPQGPYG